MIDYKSNDPRGWCGDPSRSAALGRPSIRDAAKDFAGTIMLRQVRLDDGGYDPNGTYFGTGEPLFWFANDEGTIDEMTRACNFDGARAKVLAQYPVATIERDTSDDVETMLAAYITAALFSSTDNSRDDGGDPLDKNYSDSDIAPECREQMRKDVTAFLAASAEDVGTELERAGHDFWLTRNGHGAGFWDGDWPEDAGERLTKASKVFGEVNLYLGDDGLIYG